MHIHSTFHQNLRAKNFKTNFSSETKLPVMLLLSEFLFFQCIGIRKLRGLARPLNVIESSYNFAGFISMSKRNIKSVGQSYLRTFIFLGHTNIYIYIIFIYIVTWTAFPCHTLNIQPVTLAGMARLYAVLCWTISDCPTKQFNVRLFIRPCARVSLLFYARVAKTLEHSRSLKVYCQSNESHLI